MREETRIVRSTLTKAVAGQPLHAGPVFTAPFHTPGDPTAVAYTYARSHNPTWTALERAIGEMESGDGYEAKALVFASGMAAVAAVFGAVLRPGDVVVMPSNAYFAARALVEEYFAKMGVTLRMAPTAGDGQGAELEGARLLWLEDAKQSDDGDLRYTGAQRPGAWVGGRWWRWIIPRRRLWGRGCSIWGRTFRCARTPKR